MCLQCCSCSASLTWAWHISVGLAHAPAGGWQVGRWLPWLTQPCHTVLSPSRTPAQARLHSEDSKGSEQKLTRSPGNEGSEPAFCHIRPVLQAKWGHEVAQSQRGGGWKGVK